METIADRIKEIRKKYKMSQKIFSEKIGISQGALSDIEKGKSNPSIETVISLCKQYGVSADWLLTGDSKSETNHGDYEIMYSFFYKFFNNIADFNSILDVNEKELINRFYKLKEETEVISDL